MTAAPDVLDPPAAPAAAAQGGRPVRPGHRGRRAVSSALTGLLTVIFLSGASLAWLLDIYEDSRWLVGTAACVILPALAGMTSRALTRSPIAATVASLAVTTLAGLLVILWATGELTADVFAWPEAVRSLAEIGLIESDTFLIPTATTSGMLAVTMGGALLLTWTVDTLAITWQSPALALIPALTCGAVGLATLIGALPLWFVPTLVAASASILVAGRSPRTIRAVPGKGAAAVAMVITATAAAASLLTALVAPSNPAAWQPFSGIGSGGALDLSVRLDAGRVNSSATELLRYRVMGDGREDGGFLRLVTYATLDGNEWVSADPDSSPVLGASELLTSIGGSVRVEDGLVKVYLDGTLVSSWPLTLAGNPDPSAEANSTADDFAVRSYTTDQLGELSRWIITLTANGTTSLPVPEGALTVEYADSVEASDWLWRINDRTLTRSGTATPVSYSVLAQGTVQAATPDDRFTALPEDVRAVAKRYAEEASARGLDVPQIGRDLVGWLTDPQFRYALAVNYPSGAEGLQAFFDERAGFCQHFATAMATMARSLGVPARVVVGFTPGRRLESGEFSVSGSNLHAWVELYDAQSSQWLTFDPTPASPVGPGRAQDLAQAPSSAPATPAPDVVPEAPEQQRPAAASDATADGPSLPVDSSGLGGVLAGLRTAAILLAILAGVFGFICLPALLRSRRRESRRRTGSAAAAWDEIVDSARDFGIDLHRGMPAAHAESVLCAALPTAVASQLATGLAVLRRDQDAERFAPMRGARPTITTAVRGEQHWTTVLLLREVLSRSHGLRQRLVANAAPRSLFLP